MPVLNPPRSRRPSTMSLSDSEFQLLPVKDGRLPTTVKPTHYDIQVITDLENLSFQGTVVIQCISSCFCYKSVPEV